MINIRKNLNNHKRLLFYAFAFGLAAALAFLMARGIGQSRAYTAGFRAGNIISDATMRDYNSLSESDIQTFLKSKNSCNDTNLSKTNNNVNYFSQGSPYSWHVSNGHYVCLADENINGESAAHIIYQVAQQYHINPKVLIVLLQKEQTLVTDTYPNSIQYRSATGYGCPDTAPCDSQYYGLRNQLSKAAELFNNVLNGGWTNYPVGWNYIQYSPDASCGGSNVYIENLATSALYRYTPYQPNQGALAAGSGTAPCGAYGNRNFYSYFTDWFGSTQQVFKASDLDNIYLQDGRYNILTDQGLALDVAGASKKNGANVQIYTRNNSDAQAFQITRQSDGFYKIVNINSGLALDVASASTLPGANIQIYGANSSCAQKWAISIASGRYTFRNACSGNVLDVVSGATSTASANVQTWQNNNTIAQRWTLVRLDSPNVVTDGTYSILSYRGKSLDVAGASTKNGANIQIYHTNYTIAQKYEVTRSQDGYYTIKNINSGKVLDVVSASRKSGANVATYDSNNTCAQKWVITVDKNQYYTIRNACSGLALDVAGGGTGSSGANVQVYSNNGTAAQKWIFTSPDRLQIQTSAYELLTPAGTALDIWGAATHNNTNVQIYKANHTKAQKFKLTFTSDGYYTITNSNANKPLDVAGASSNNGANVQIYGANNTCAQKWFLTKSGDGYVIRNACSGKALDVSGGAINNSSTNVQIYEFNGTNAQLWQLSPAE